jgi:phenazine biosynthesis protein phzE
MRDPVLDPLLAVEPPPFALVHRPDATGPDTIDVLIGDVLRLDRIADLPLTTAPGPARERQHELLVLLPYRQLVERGYACRDDGEPLLALRPAVQAVRPVADVLQRLPDVPAALLGCGFDVPDAEYAAAVRRIVTEEIGTGEGCNFVLSRSFVGRIADHSPRRCLAVYRRLLGLELGAYWTFIVHTGDRTFIGATPERHISLRGGTAVMNPISGTYRYGPAGPSAAEARRFLDDTKETDELYMVVDEELKMMAQICEGGGRIRGPYLKEMARLAHTEYMIEGRSRRDVRDVLRLTMFMPAVMGSPLESSCRAIHRHERTGRGYYAGAIALIGRDGAGQRELDSAILIRTADVDRGGRLRIRVGSTLVRHSDPDDEAAETRAKAAAVVAAFDPAATDHARCPSDIARPTRPLAEDPGVRAALAGRNANLARFWLAGHVDPALWACAPRRGRVLVVDAEDAFVAMLGHQLRSLGQEVELRSYRDPWDPSGFDLVVVGPGPGDPRQHDDPKIGTLERITRELLDAGTPLLAVCLGHQVLSCMLGMPLVRKSRPNQGTQLAVDLFGDRHLAGFYNTFTAVSAEDWIERAGCRVEVSRDTRTGEVHGLRGPGFRSLQFHPESILTQRGVTILRNVLIDLLGRAT